ncbi:hypothetical protein ACT2FY_09180 [Paraburkholderia fungorum]|uniref:hypothetical protein n=1 Tax=Paraburkholderia fungorum TaxID=134537 RepID=UPI00402B5D08
MKRALIFGPMIVGDGLARHTLEASTVFCFWQAYILTRPFGAARDELLAQRVTGSWLDLGAAMTSNILLPTIVGPITCLCIYRYHSGEERV